MTTQTHTILTFDKAAGAFVWTVDGTPRGTAERVPVRMHVGGGTAVHAGITHRVTVTEEYDQVDRFGRRTVVHAGETFDLEPDNFCGTASTYKTGGYANGWRGRNRIAAPDADITCTKCLRRMAS